MGMVRHVVMLLILSISAAPDAAAGVHVCPLDIGFILDSSGSMMPNNWEQILNFVIKFVSRINVSPEMSDCKVGVVNFGRVENEASVDISLNAFDNAEDLKNSVAALHFYDGFGDISAGLRVLREELFTDTDVDRRAIRKVAVLLTDSHDNVNTLPESEACRESGIDIFAIGIGGNAVVMQAIANLGQDFFFENFQQFQQNEETILESIFQILNVGTEDVHAIETGAAGVCPLDIGFILDSSESMMPNNWALILNFVNKFVSRINVGPEMSDCKVGVVSFGRVEHEASVDISLNAFDNAEDLKSSIAGLQFYGGVDDISAGLRVLREELFSTATGDRMAVHNVAFLLADTSMTSSGMQNIRFESEECHAVGIDVFAIGIGENAALMHEIANFGRVFSFEKFQQFQQNEESILDSIFKQLP